MFKKIIAEARSLIESGPPGKLSRKWDRGSSGADSFRSYTKRATNRARRRAEKKMLDDTPKKMTKGYQHATWPSNPVYTQKLYDKPGAFSSKKPKTEAVMDEGGGSRATKAARQDKAYSRMAPQASASGSRSKQAMRGISRATQGSDYLKMKASTADAHNRAAAAGKLAIGGKRPVGAADVPSYRDRLRLRKKFGGKLF